MLRYEALMLTVPEITQDEARRIESEVERVIKGAKGSTIAFDRWGKHRLAYPVKKKDYGIYYLARFEVENPTEVLEELKSIFAVKLNDLVMRHMISAIDPKRGLEYERPLSVEEAPAKEMHGFLREPREGHESRADFEEVLQAVDDEA